MLRMIWAALRFLQKYDRGRNGDAQKLAMVKTALMPLSARVSSIAGTGLLYHNAIRRSFIPVPGFCKSMVPFDHDPSRLIVPHDHMKSMQADRQRVEQPIHTCSPFRDVLTALGIVRGPCFQGTASLAICSCTAPARFQT